MDAISAAGLWLLVVFTDTRQGLIIQSLQFTSEETCIVEKNKILEIKHSSVINVHCIQK